MLRVVIFSPYGGAKNWGQEKKFSFYPTLLLENDVVVQFDEIVH